MNNNNILEDFTSQLNAIDTVENLNLLFESTLNSFGLSQWAYQLTRLHIDDTSDPQIITNFPEEWLNYYVESNYSAIDPVVTQSEHIKSMFVWSDLLKQVELSKSQQTIFNEASEFELDDGVGIPILGINGLKATISMACHSTDELNRILLESKPFIQATSHLYHFKLTELTPHQTSLNTMITLSPREKECLLWLAQGKTASGIADILSIAERTVVYHVENAKNKLGASNRTHAVAKAIFENYITL